jgi:ADP-ribose pyrophosphatase YjhB (NUDIX family)
MLPHYRHFNHCPRCGAPGTGEAPGNPFRCGACGFVLFFNAASAVAAFVADAEGRVLYTRRAKDPARGRLGMPGGFVDEGETAEQALRREVTEEVGLELRSLRYLCSHANEYLYKDVRYHTLDLFFTATAVDPGRARSLDAVDAIEWLDPATVAPADVAFESMRRALADYLAARTP